MKKLIGNLKQPRGFTLIELLAVIAILGVLIAIAAPNVMGAVERAEAESLRADAKAVKNAAITYITLERVDRGEDEGLSDTIEVMVINDGTLTDYIDMSAERAEKLDKDVETGDSWGTFIDNLDKFISNNDDD